MSGTEGYTPEFYVEQQRLAREHEALAKPNPIEPTRSLEELEAEAAARREQRVKDQMFEQFGYLAKDEQDAYIEAVRNGCEEIAPALIIRVLRALAMARWSAHCHDIH